MVLEIPLINPYIGYAKAKIRLLKYMMLLISSNLVVCKIIYALVIEPLLILILAFIFTSKWVKTLHICPSRQPMDVTITPSNIVVHPNSLMKDIYYFNARRSNEKVCVSHINYITIAKKVVVWSIIKYVLSIDFEYYIHEFTILSIIQSKIIMLYINLHMGGRSIKYLEFIYAR